MLKNYAFTLLDVNVQFILKIILFKIKIILFERLLNTFFLCSLILFFFFTKFIKIMKIHLKVFKIALNIYFHYFFLFL